MPTPPPDRPANERPRVRVRVVKLASTGGAVALAAALGFGLSHAAPTQDDSATIADDAAAAAAPDAARPPA